MPSNTQNITPDITPTAAPTAMSITRHRSDPRVAHLVAVDAVGRACGACSEACAEESWRYGCEDGRAMMKSFWSMPRTVSRRSRQSPWPFLDLRGSGRNDERYYTTCCFAEHASWISLYPKYRYKYSKSGRTVQSSTPNPHDFIKSAA